MTTSTKEQNAAQTAGNNGFSLISNQKLFQLYTAMLKCRMIDERVRALVEPGKLAGSDNAAVCHEAAAVGVAIDLLPEDTVAPSHRNFLVNFIKGVPLEVLFRGLFARAARSQTAAQLDSQLTAATGVALNNKMTRNGKIVAAFRDDGAASLQPWHEALGFAGVQQLPILFVSHSNLPAEPESLNVQAGIEENASEVHGFPSIAVDGNDVVAVYRVATEAITHARKGNGPTLIECKTGRSKALDPILNMETYLRRKGLFSEEMKIEVTVAFTRELDAAVKSAKDSPFSNGAVKPLNRQI